VRTAVLLLGAAWILGAANGGGPLWQNGEPDMRNAIIASTVDEGGAKPPVVTQIADDFQNSAWWKVTDISLHALFGGIRVGHDDPENVGKSNRVEVRIYKPDDGGKPGELFWSTKLEGQEAQACQSFTGDVVRLGTTTFPEAEEPGADVDGKLVNIAVAEPEGLVTLPPGRWFVSWEVQAADNEFSLYVLTAPYPCPGFAGDASVWAAGARPNIVEIKGVSFLWGELKRRYEHHYNLPFSIFGEELDGPP
jgi:hypothetical protein